MNARAQLRGLMREYVERQRDAAKLCRHLAAVARDPMAQNARTEMQLNLKGQEAIRRLRVFPDEFRALWPHVLGEIEAALEQGDDPSLAFAELQRLCEEMGHAEAEFEAASTEHNVEEAALQKRLAE